MPQSSVSSVVKMLFLSFFRVDQAVHSKEFDMSHSGPVMDSPPPRQSARVRSVQVAKAGVSFGSALAIAISWSVHHSIIWAIIHGFLSWLYIIWYAITR
ncbi:hypothetical protein BH09GEM1_BH09GEM1_27840 [soil metagenome]